MLKYDSKYMLYIATVPTVIVLGLCLLLAPSFLFDISFLNDKGKEEYRICGEKDLHKVSNFFKCFITGLTEWTIVIGVLMFPLLIYFCVKECRHYRKYGVCSCYALRGMGLSEMETVIEYRIRADGSQTYGTVIIV